MERYDIIYSLGRDCSCASYLQRSGLRLTSGPFDWVTNANLEERFELLLNDFQYFFDKEYLKPQEKQCDHYDKYNDYYENVRTNIYFWHDFPVNMPFEEAYIAAKEKYNRRINRFYENIKNNEKVLLVWFSKFHQTPDDVVLDLCNRFCAKMNKKIYFLIIEHQEGAHKTIRYKLSDNIERCHCHAVEYKKDGSHSLLGNVKLVQPIFSKLCVMNPFVTSMYRLKLHGMKIIGRILCLITPVKSWRRKIRQKF